MSSRFLDRLLGTTREDDPAARSGSDRPTYDPQLDAVPRRTGSEALAALSHPHLADPGGVDDETVREQAWAYRDRARRQRRS